MQENSWKQATISRNDSKKLASAPSSATLWSLIFQATNSLLNDLAGCFREASKDLVIDDIDKAYELAKKANSVLYLGR